MEFTGNYYKCNECNHIWDFMGICPNCGKDNQTDLNAKEVREIVGKMFDEQDRLKVMLETHGNKQLRIGVVSQQRELLNGFAEWLKNDDDHNLINKYTVDAYLESI